MGMINFAGLALPVTPLLLAAAFIVSLFVGKRLATTQHKEIDSALFTTLITGVLAARLAFVIRFWATYKLTPLSIIDIRDGGFYPWIGVVAGCCVAVWYVWRNSSLRRALLIALLTGACTAGLSGAAVWALRPTPSDIRLPAGIFTALNGNTMRIDAFLGKPVVINLWASWCPPCRREMPMLQQAQADNGDVVFIFANQGEAADTVHQYLSAERVNIHNVILDADMKVAKHAGSMAFPTTLFFDSRGRLQNIRMGELSAASLAQRLETLHLDHKD
ncbi:TlpA disulfide reductase family protein [Glaciimonas sp. PCH181]|uniref:TlpA disulfide reductase family protein n=1 Tax=Glaciimonas sp. PCH181 TaxID=2133943 RepID=UPI000D367D5F|nr:TlpA disulfide reductase family protein [Glaciimonas sp. PCH181]PUA19719.1 hypothetical protein C7W93_07785 [Glaciimonas sp. PCH181]